MIYNYTGLPGNARSLVGVSQPSVSYVTGHTGRQKQCTGLNRGFVPGFAQHGEFGAVSAHITFSQMTLYMFGWLYSKDHKLG